MKDEFLGMPENGLLLPFPLVRLPIPLLRNSSTKKSLEVDVHEDPIRSEYPGRRAAGNRLKSTGTVNSPSRGTIATGVGVAMRVSFGR